MKKNQHIALFSDDEEKSSIIQARFLKNGLERGEVCAYLSYKNRDKIIQMLKNTGLEVEKYLKSKQFQVIQIDIPNSKGELAELFDKKIVPLFSGTFKPTVIVGEPIPELNKKENMEIKIKLEKDLHEMIQDNFSILCPYDNSEIEPTEKSKWLSQLFKSHNGAVFSPKETEGLAIYF